MPLDPLKIAKESLGKAIETEKRNRKLLESIGPAVIDALQPILQGLKEAVSLLRVDVTPIVEVNPEIKIPEIKIPDIKVPDIYVPEIVVPEPKVTVNVPPIKIPDVIMPEEMNVRGWVSLMGVDINNPLPVQLRDAKGNPVNLFENLTQIVSGGGGGNMRGFVQIKGLTGSTGTDLLNADNRLRVSLETGGSGLTDAELRATSVPIEQVSGSTWSVSVNDVFRTTVASTTLNSDNRLRVSLETGGSGLTDAELRASGVPIAQVSGATWSVEATATNLDIRDLANATDSISGYQVSGAVWSVSVNDSFRTTVASNLINADDRLRVSLETGGSGLTDTELRASSVPISQVSGAIWSVSVNDVFRTTVVSNLINADDRLRVSVETGGGGLTDAELRASSVPISQVSGANWSVNVSGFSATVNVTGSVAADVADDGESPVKIGGIARTTNPTKVADGDRVSMTLDSCGRQVVWPYQVRDLLQTAYVTLSNGTQQVLLAGSAGVFHDLISVSVTNSSTVADTAVSTFAIVDLRSATNGGIVQTLVVKNGRTVIFQPPVPIKQDVAADAWMADMNDINMVGGLITVSALFIKNI